MNQRRGQKRGYILVVVVLVLSILCCLLAQIASMVHHQTRELQLQEKAMRHQWALLSLRRVLLRHGAAILEQVERERNLHAEGAGPNRVASYVATFTQDIPMNEEMFHVVLADESAKIPLLRLAMIGQRRMALDGVEKFEQVAGFEWEHQGEPGDRGAFIAFHDWVAHRRSMDRIEPPAVCSLWNVGKVNVYRCSDEVVTWLWQQLFGRFPPEELWLARSQYPPLDWNKLRVRCRLSEDELKLADSLFETQGSEVSLRIRFGTEDWIFGQNENGPVGVRLR